MDLSNESVTSRSDLATACSEGDYDHARELLAIGADPITSRAGYFNWSSLHFTAQQGRLKFAQVLMTQYGCHPQVEDKEGRTPLHVACQHGNLEFAQYMIKVKRCDASYLDIEDQPPLHHVCGSLSECTEEDALRMTNYLVKSAKCDPLVVDVNGKNAMLHASEKGFCSVLKFLVEDRSCDLGAVDYRGNNALHLAVSFGRDFETVRYILSKEVIVLESVNNKSNNVLHMAAIANCSLEICNLILNCSKSGLLVEVKNECDSTPLDLAKPELFHLIVSRFHLRTKKFYDKYAASLGITPLKGMQAKVFIVGDSGAGKTMLVRTLKKETSPLISSFSLSFSHHSLSPPVPYPSEERGLQVTQFDSKFYGGVAFYTFSGHSEVKTLQEAFLEVLVRPLPNIFMIVIDYSKPPEEINLSLHKWLSFLSRSWKDLSEVVPKILVVGTHADLSKYNGKLSSKLVSLDNLESCVGKYKIVDTILVDSSKSDHSGITALRKELGVVCDRGTDKASISFNASCLLTFLNNKLVSSLAITLNSVLEDIKSYCVETGMICDLRFFLSDEISILMKLLTELKNSGYILFLLDEANVSNSLVCIDISGLFAELANIYTNTRYGEILIDEHKLVMSSNFSALFSDADLILSILNRLNLATPLLSDQGRMQMDQKRLNNLLYLPGVVSTAAPKGTWDSRSHYEYSFGWILEFGNTCRISFRSLHVILLRCFAIAESFIDFDNLSLWKNGFFFSTKTKIPFEVVVEASVGLHSIFVLQRAQKPSPPCLELRSHLVRTIRKSAKELCLRSKSVELIMDPFDSEQYPLQSRKNLTLFEMPEVVNSIATGNPIVKSANGVTISVRDILQLEPLSYLSRDCLTILSEVQPTEVISDSFLRSLAVEVSSCRDWLVFFCSLLSLGAPPHNAVVDSLYSLLLSWRESNETYDNLILPIESISLIYRANVIQ